MTKIGFYHLTKSPLEKALPKLLDKALAAGHRALVLTGTEERAEYLAGQLWTQDPDSWLPHGTKRDGEAALQPIWITETDENPNGADLLVMVDGIQPARIDGFVRCLDLFDGGDEEAVAQARERWKKAKAEGHEIAYWQQTDKGGWEQKA